MRWLKTFWFLIALAAAIVLAYLAPGLPLRLGSAAGAIRTAAIIGVFAIGGLTLPTRTLRNAIGHGRLHLYIQGFNLALIPAIAWGLRWLLLRGGMHPDLADGFVILACVPTTVASCVAMTAMARGNVAGAICNSTLGNLLGVFVSPLLVYLLLATLGTLEWGRILRGLGMLIVLPTVVGQLVRFPFRAWFDARKAGLTMLSQVCLLVVIYLVFASTFSLEFALSAASLLLVVSLVASLHVLLLALNWRLSAMPCWAFTRADRIAALLCGTQKTVAMGIPLILVIYDHGPQTGLISIPLLCYHPLQLLIGTFLALQFASVKQV